MKRKFNGAISIFMTIIVTMSFMLGGLFIDATRIVAAKNKVHTSMNAAARSAMSYYEEELVSEYGLFGVEQDKLDENFQKYFKLNMTKSGYEGIKLFEYTLNDDKISMKGTKTFTDTMADQIVEYEKYRMPVTTTVALIERIKGVFDGMKAKAKKASKSVDALDNLKTQFGDSKNIISNAASSIGSNIANQLVNDIVGFAEDFANKAAEEIRKEIENSTDTQIGRVRTEISKMEAELNKLVSKRRDYQLKLDELNGTAAGVGPVTSSDGEAEAMSEAESYKNVIAQMDKEISDLRSEIEKLKSEVNDIETTIKDKAAKLEAAINAYKLAVSARESSEQKLSNKKDELKINEKEQRKAAAEADLSDFNRRLNEFLSGLTLSDQESADFNSFKAAVDTNNAAVENGIYQNYIYDANMRKLFDDYRTSVSKTRELESLNQVINQNRSDIAVYEQDVAAKKSVEESKKSDVERIRNELKDTANKLKTIQKPHLEDVPIKALKVSVKSTLDSDSTIIGRVKNFISQMTETMPPIATGNDGEATNEKGVIKSIKRTIDDFNAFTEMLSSIENVRDQLFYIDYIMGKCTYLTSQSEKAHFFNYAEVEYIIFGHDTQVANVLSALTSIYLMRFAINTVNYFVTSADPELISRIVYALGRGAAQSLLDLKDMIVVDLGGEEAKGCALCPSVDTIRLTYSDHLRLLLILKSKNALKGLEATMNATLVNENKVSGTRSYYTEAEANVEVEVNLILIPAFTDILPLGDRFKNGKYVIKDSVTISY